MMTPLYSSLNRCGLAQPLTGLPAVRRVDMVLGSQVMTTFVSSSSKYSSGWLEPVLGSVWSVASFGASRVRQPTPTSHNRRDCLTTSGTHHYHNTIQPTPEQQIFHNSPCSLVTRNFSQLRSWWLSGVLQMLGDIPRSRRLIAVMMRHYGGE